MTKKELDTVTLDHCDFCGGTYFDMYEINRITASTAEKLKKLMKSASISGELKVCPNDQTVMKPVEQESIPENTTLLRCDKCGGVFAFPDDLVSFKKAQSSKIDYLSSWYQPAPAVSKLFVLSLVLAIAAGIFYNAIFSQRAAPSRADQICTPQATLAEDSTIIYCTTEYEYLSNAVFVDTQTNEQVTRTINANPATVHLLTVPYSDIQPNENVCVKIALTSGGQSRETTCVPLQP